MTVHKILYTLLCANEDSDNEIIVRESVVLLENYFNLIRGLCTREEDLSVIDKCLSDVVSGKLNCNSYNNVYNSVSKLITMNDKALKFLICDEDNFDIADLELVLNEFNCVGSSSILLLGYCIGYHVYNKSYEERFIESLLAYTEEYGYSDYKFDCVVGIVCCTIFKYFLLWEYDENYCKLGHVTTATVQKCISIAFDGYNKLVEINTI